MNRADIKGLDTLRRDKYGNPIRVGDRVKTLKNVGIVRYSPVQWLFEVAEEDEAYTNERIPAGIPENDWEVLL